MQAAIRYLWIVLTGVLFALPARSEKLEPPIVQVSLASGGEVIAAAYLNLFGAGSTLWIETSRKGQSGAEERSRFLVFQRANGPARETLTVNFEPGGKQTGRFLQIDREGSATKTFVYAAKNERTAPQATPFRLADPFLCNFYDPAEGGDAEAGARARNMEVLAKSHGSIDGEDVHWLTVRWLGSQGYDRVELAVSVQDNAILEYRHYLEAKDKAPSMIAKAARSDMVTVAGRIVPGKLSYDDLDAKETILVTIQHRSLPEDLPGRSFDPNAFHLVDLDVYLKSAPW